jgi:hypothetical protein
MALALIIATTELEGNSIKLMATPIDGVGPYSYVWYMSTTPGFTPGPSNDIPGATTESIEVTGLIPNTVYYFVAEVTDAGLSNDTATSNEAVGVTAAGDLNPNQFEQSTVMGKTDLMVNTNTVAMEVSALEPGVIRSGYPVKIDTTSKRGIPKVLRATADTDRIVGYVNFNPKQNVYKPGERMQVSMAGNCIMLPAAGAIPRGGDVVLNADPAAVSDAALTTGKRIVGWAYDGAAGAGELIRVILVTPNGALDA